MKKTHFYRACLLALWLVLLPSVANAAPGDEFIAGGIKYRVSQTDDMVGVIANGYTEANYTIPDIVLSSAGQTYTVHAIYEEAFRNCTDLRTVILPNTVGNIHEGAFAGSGLTSITLSNRLGTIGERAFANSKLTSIDLPDSLANINTEAFRECGDLAAVTFGNSLENIGVKAFENCGALRTVTLCTDPSKKLEIALSAFAGCNTLSSVTLPALPAAKISITGYAFDGCSALTSVTYLGDKPAGLAASSGIYINTNSGLVSYYPAGNATWVSTAGSEITDVSPNRIWRDRKLQAHTPALAVTPITSFPAGNAGTNCTVTIANSRFASFNATNCFASAKLGSHALDLGTVGGPVGSDGSVANGASAIVVTLQEAYLNTLAPGAYPLEVTLKGTDYDGVILSATLTVTAPPPPPPPVPAPAAGGSPAGTADATYAATAYGGSWRANALTVQADYARFLYVMVDGVQLTVGRDCTVTSGSTVVTFMPAYLATLKDGTHTLRVQFTDGHYNGTFTTPLAAAVTAVAVPHVPATGGAGPWGLLLMAAAVFMANAARKRGR